MSKAACQNALITNSTGVNSTTAAQMRAPFLSHSGRIRARARLQHLHFCLCYLTFDVFICNNRRTEFITFPVRGIRLFFLVLQQTIDRRSSSTTMQTSWSIERQFGLDPLAPFSSELTSSLLALAVIPTFSRIGKANSNPFERPTAAAAVQIGSFQRLLHILSMCALA